MTKIIVNGGTPLEGCPKDWDEAKLIQDKLNSGKDESYYPKWSFDCGFKLDFDGPLLKVSSRFYPPKEHYGKTWDGTVNIYLMSNIVETKAFDCETLEELQKHAEEFVNGWVQKLEKLLIVQ